MAEISKRISVRLNNADVVLSSINQYRAKIASALVESIKGMTLEGALQMLQLLTDHLREQTENLRAQEMTYIAEHADDPAALQARDESQTLLFDKLQQIRKFLRANTPHKMKDYGLKKSIPNAFRNLRDYSLVAANLLSANQTPIETTLGLSFIPASLGAQLQVLAQDFNEKLGEVLVEDRELDEALINRDLALDRWQLAYQSVSNIFTGFYQIAGKPELARRIRPTTRKTNGDTELKVPETEAAEETEGVSVVEASGNNSVG